jgi:phytoene dehydrogenase-like protein
MAEKRIAIIGAGIAGLAAGCYARMNGYGAEIFEAHSLPGGMCTAWKRKGYTIDGCLHWLVGARPGNRFFGIWQELGAVQGRRMITPDVFYRYTDLDGRTLTIYTDADRLAAHVKELSPADAEAADEYARLVKRYTKMMTPLGKPFELYSRWDFAKMILRMAPMMKDIRLAGSLSAGTFAERFKDPLLREGFTRMLYEQDYALAGILFNAAVLHMGCAAFPEGGSLEFARAIEKRFLDLGGKVTYNAKVEKILVAGDRAVGIRLGDGSEARADYVVSAADLRTTVYSLLDGKYVDPQHEELFRSCKLVPSCVQVSYGVDMDLSSGHYVVGDWHRLARPLRLGREDVEWLLFRDFCADPSLAPKGKSVVECMILSHDFDYWEKLHADPPAYRAEKERIREIVTAELERQHPGFRSKIEMTDVATPMTYVRYTGSWKGTFMTWLMTPENTRSLQVVHKTLPGLADFWLTGVWVKPPGGVPAAAWCSRDVVQLICHQDRKRFVITKP